MQHDPTAGELDEDTILGYLLKRFRQPVSAVLGAGDDAAVMRPEAGFPVLSTDMLVEDRDFRTSTFSYFNIGWKAAAVNLSDIAAMGGTPSGLVVALGFPPHTKLSQLLELADGIQAACGSLAPGVGVVGGDLSSSDSLIISICAMGMVTHGSPVTRSGARVGDQIAYAGELGLASAGLAVLESGVTRQTKLSARTAQAVMRQMRPSPRIGRGKRALQAGATSLIDVSDGLAQDAARIADASGVTLDFDAAPLAALVAELGWVRHELKADPWRLVMAGGEDYGLLGTFPVAAELPEGFVRLGTVKARAHDRVTLEGRSVTYLGWDHFR